MARYAAVKPDLRRRGRYWRWGVSGYREGRHVAMYRGEFAKSRAEGHARFPSGGGFGDFAQIFRGRGA